MASYKKEDAYRVLHLLEEYRDSLPSSDSSEEVTLRLALDNLIAAIRARLFTALSELLEFYNECLLDPSKPSEEKCKYSSTLALHWQQGSLPPVSPARKPQDPNTGYYEYELLVNRADRELGLSVTAVSDAGLEPGIYISDIAAESASAQYEKLRLGDRIMEVNKVPFSSLSQASAASQLSSIAGDVQLLLRRYTENKPAVERKICVVGLTKLNGSFGFTIKGGTDAQLVNGHDGVFISKLFKNGAAEKTGQLSAGDRIISVNGSNIEHVTHDEAVKVLSSSGEHIHITVEKGAFTMDNIEDLNSVRDVTLERGENGYGMNIVGREAPSLAVYVSQITAGGPADRSQKVFKGDRILEVNEQDVRQVTHEVVASIFRSSQHRVRIKVQNAEEGWDHMTNGSSDPNASLNITTFYQDTFFLRAWFHFDPSVEPDIPDPGLMFGQDNILCVVNSTNTDWWQACRVDDFGKFGPCGLIPSEKYQLKREQMKSRSVHFPDQDSSDLESTEPNKVNRRLFHKSKKIKKPKQSKGAADTDSVSASPFYTHVEKREVEVRRPVILLGPLKDHLNDMLVQEYSTAYAGCVPHTSRSQRQNEEHGVDYYFVSTETMEQLIAEDSFIEAGHFNQNLYGTTARAVRDVLEAQRHCILSVSPQSIPRLEQAGLSPIVILLHPTSANALLELPEYQDSRHTQLDDFTRQMELSNQINEEYADQLTGVAKGDNIGEILYSVTNIINANSYKIEWIPVKFETQ